MVPASAAMHGSFLSLCALILSLLTFATPVGSPVRGEERGTETHIGDLRLRILLGYPAPVSIRPTALARCPSQAFSGVLVTYTGDHGRTQRSTAEHSGGSFGTMSQHSARAG